MSPYFFVKNGGSRLVTTGVTERQNGKNAFFGVLAPGPPLGGRVTGPRGSGVGAQGDEGGRAQGVWDPRAQGGRVGFTGAQEGAFPFRFGATLMLPQIYPIPTTWDIGP